MLVHLVCIFLAPCALILGLFCRQFLFMFGPNSKIPKLKSVKVKLERRDKEKGVIRYQWKDPVRFFK